MAGEFLLQDLGHAGAEGEEVGHQLAGGGGQAAASGALAADLGVDQFPAEGLLGLLEAGPDVAVTLAEVGRRLLDRAGAVHRPEDLTDAVAEGVPATRLEPD